MKIDEFLLLFIKDHDFFATLLRDVKLQVDRLSKGHKKHEKRHLIKFRHFFRKKSL
jgi:hypothetical protein